jgi:hypothetical protein
MKTSLIALFLALAAMAAFAAEGDAAMANGCCAHASPAPSRTVAIVWERLVEGGETCPRCGTTGDEVNKAAEQLSVALGALGVAVTLEEKELTLAEFKADPSRSNRVWLNGRLLEDWLGGVTGASPCCDVCGDEECRTVDVAGTTYEAIPADLIVKAGLLAAAALPPAPPKNTLTGPCCP